MQFVDTNVLLYAVCPGRSERPKAEVAREILRGGALVLSVQVLQEFYVQATRTGRAHPLTHEEAVSLIEL
jgi:predicted nucleic acid-binding protein